MIRPRWSLMTVTLALVACSTLDERGTIAQLRHRQIELKDVQLDDGFERAIESYQRLLEETPESALTPEAIRRLADLKVEKEYGHIAGTGSESLPAPELERRRDALAPETAPAAGPEERETDAEFERRTTGRRAVASATTEEALATGEEGRPAGVDDLERAGPLEAIALYRKLLDKYPLYERNDQVLYQMSRAYEELGRIEEAMQVMNRLVRDFPGSRYLDEVQFRRAEYFFTRRRFLDAEEAYASIVTSGVASTYYQLALYKLGWTFYKQELYEEALHRFMALLDYKVSIGYDFDQTDDEQERKRTDDTFRVISLGLSNVGGAAAAEDYFSRYGQRPYEDSVYRNLGEYYFDKRRYSDAAATYDAFVRQNPFHEVAPQFHLRMIEIHAAGGFPSLVIEAKKAFATTYGLNAPYWNHFEPEKRPEVLAGLKANLTDLANHYHALYQKPKESGDKPAHLAEARQWYRAFLASFPDAPESPAVNYQLADLLLENRSFGEAAAEYEKTAYDYPAHDKASTAGYAAVYAYREHLGATPEAEKGEIRDRVVRSSLRFAATFPEHEKAAIVLGAAADDLYGMGEHGQALAAARTLIEHFPGAEADIVRAAWLVVAHASYELSDYAAAEAAYQEVLDRLPEDDASRSSLSDNLAASIYKQGEQAIEAGDDRAGADHFLRIGAVAPASRVRPTAEYDAAAALIRLGTWKEAATVLAGFRDHFPGHELQPEVTKKIAYVYRQDEQWSLAAGEFERIERESDDEEVRREALLTAAELHEKAADAEQALRVCRRYVDNFSEPVELNLEMRSKIAGMLKERGEREPYLAELRSIVAIEAAAGAARTPRTRYLAATSALVLAEPGYERFVAVRLIQPFQDNLRTKQDLMKQATRRFAALVEYEVGEVTAAATFYLAEIYAHFSRALLESERPQGLDPLELEQYELAIEEQAYPFEEQAIAVHQSNLELMRRGIYNAWIDKSLWKLARFMPARYDKPEAESVIVASPESFVYVIDRPADDADSETVASTGPEVAADVTADDNVPVTLPDATASGESAVVEEEPGVIEEEPAAVEEESAVVEEEPAAVEEEPAAVEEEPAAVEEEPAAVEDVPAVREGEPNDADE